MIKKNVRWSGSMESERSSQAPAANESHSQHGIKEKGAENINIGQVGSEKSSASTRDDRGEVEQGRQIDSGTSSLFVTGVYDHANDYTIHPAESTLRRPHVAGPQVNPSAAHDAGQTSLAALDGFHEALVSPATSDRDLSSSIRQLYSLLRNQKRVLGQKEWQDFVLEARQHPICDVLHEDPFTWRAFSKPRGYAGDAVLMDYIYGREEARSRPVCSPIGARIFDINTVSSACRGVMARRGFVADLIDDVCRSNSEASIMSVACGHLREAGLSSAVRRRALGKFIAIDSDAESLAEVDKCYHRTPIECVHASARRIITGRLDAGQFDLIYSLGLYDYLQQPMATRLTSRLFQMLKPGGLLVVANFLPSVECVGYMEAFMDWNLIYRDRFEMMALTEEIPEAEVTRVSTFAEAAGNVVFAIVQRKTSVK